MAASQSRVRASAPTTEDDRQYHLHTKKGDIAPYCLLVGDPGRATMIAETLFENAKLVGAHRGLKSYTGTYNNIPVSVVTTGMGAPSTCIVLPEAYDSGARLFIRVGTCGALIREAVPGSAIIVDSALRLESTSRNYAPEDVPALPNSFVLEALIQKAKEFRTMRYFIGKEATTDCFREGQGRPNTEGILTEHAEATHKYVLAQGAMCYSMEASALFIWCATHWGGIPCGAINNVVANRITEEFDARPEQSTPLIALEAIVSLSQVFKF